MHVTVQLLVSGATGTILDVFSRTSYENVNEYPSNGNCRDKKVIFVAIHDIVSSLCAGTFVVFQDMQLHKNAVKLLLFFMCSVCHLIDFSLTSSLYVYLFNVYLKGTMHINEHQYKN